MNENTQMIVSLYDGKRSSREIARIVGLSPRYVRKVAKQKGLDQLHCGAQPGEVNHQFVSGRRVDLDGYVLITAPPDHYSARKRPHRNGRIIFEHRMVLEKKLERPLHPGEVSHHKDGLTLHNDPSNLLLFDQNKDHLRATITGHQKKISVSGRLNIKARYHLPEDYLPVDTFYRRRRRGDVRLLQILLAALKFGIDSPFLLGTHRHLEKAGIDPSSRSMLEHALDDLYQRYEADLLL
jgi:hypothetical protein